MFDEKFDEKQLSRFALECFGNFFTRGKWAKEVMPTEDIRASIECILKSRKTFNSENFEDN